jgi:hypothetical protein
MIANPENPVRNSALPWLRLRRALWTLGQRSKFQKGSFVKLRLSDIQSVNH